MKFKRSIICLLIALFFLPLVIGGIPSIQWGDTPLKTKLPPVVITGESTFKVLESRKIPIPSPFLPGGKAQPVILVSTTREPTVPEENKQQPMPQTPGCTYHHSITTKVATLFKGAEAYEKRGKYLFLNRRYSEAIETFSHLIAVYPGYRNLGDAYYWLGESYFQVDDIQRAAQNYKITAKRYPSSSCADYACYSLGWIAYRKKRFDSAIKYFKRGIFAYPNSPIYDHMLFWLAESYMQKEETEQANKFFKRVIEKSSNPSLLIPAIFEKAKIEFIKGNYAKSKETLEELLRRNPPYLLVPKIQLLEGWCEYFLRDPQALSTFTHILQTPKVSDTTRTEAEYGKCLSAIQQEKPVIAERLLATMGPSSQWYGEVAIELASYFFHRKAYKHAEKLCGKIISDFPKTPYLERAYMILGNCAYNTKAFSHAIEDYTHVLLGRVKNVKPMARFAKGLAFYQVGQFRDAIDSWEILLSRYPDFSRRSEALYWLGSAYLNLQDEVHANFYFNQLSQYPEFHSKALIQLSEFWFGQQKWSKALKVLRRFLSLYPHSIHSGYVKGMMGEIYFNLKEYKKASKWLSKSIKDKKIANDLEYRAKLAFILGKVYYRMGDFQHAINYFSYISSKLPKNSFSDDAQYWKALSYYSQQLFQASIRSFEQLLKRFPHSPLTARAIIKIADCYYNLKDYARSETYYQRALVLFGKNKNISEKASYGRILSLYQRGNYPLFCSEASAFLKQFSYSSLSLNVVQLLSEYYEKQGDIDDEIALLEDYLMKHHHSIPQTDSIRLNLAKLFVKKGLYDSALVQLRLVSGKNAQRPFSSVAEKEMGDLYFKQKQYNQAIFHYNKFLSFGGLAPEMVRYVRKQLVDAFIKTGQLKDAKHVIGIGTKSYGLEWGAPLYLKIGKAYQHRKMYKTALTSYKEAAKITDPIIKCHALVSMASIYQKTRKYDKSLKILLLVRYTYPECCVSSEKALLELAVIYGRKGRKDEARQLLSVLSKSHNREVKGLARKALSQLH